ncbi:VOC family protein [Pseudomonas putida]|uniref:VOC family protein n=1 Tax=Pseudomonas putida TaxID=303 RepID=UPI000B3D0A9C|nr:VOC family protein [Pseudomonas putida]OUS82863.1 2,3-dihydroxy-p-cumate-3,4-dioxygenase [Pseudomonas putida]OUS88310.1 2,3-dihydroxy-p-cumate-3,4-dioxygenase [Pseudomonas putida]
MDITLPFRYKKLAYAAINVTDLSRSVPFYRDIVGLDLVKQDGDIAYFRCSRDHHNIVLYQAPGHGLKRVGFELEQESDVRAAFEHFDQRGMQPTWVSAEEAKQLRQGLGFRVRERHSGLLFELFVGNMHLSNPFVPTVAKIARIGHVVIGSENFEGSRDSLVDDFGFRVSDLIEDRIIFMRCHPNPFHHTFAVGPASSSHFHHVNFMVTDIDDIGKALYRIKQHDIKVVFGPGRHPPSDSVFFYFLDPDGITVEYSFGMEEFAEHGARPPRYMEPVPESLDAWGAVPDGQFGRSGPIERERMPTPHAKGVLA